MLLLLLLLEPALQHTEELPPQVRSACQRRLEQQESQWKRHRGGQSQGRRSQSQSQVMVLLVHSQGGAGTEEGVAPLQVVLLLLLLLV